MNRRHADLVQKPAKHRTPSSPPTNAGPAYLRIVSQLRHQIAQGTLQPGDRVPSTRDLARTWNVAMATAAHALQTLTREGVLRAVPRSGTVVAGSPSRGPAMNGGAREIELSHLSQERIVRAAIAHVDEHGLSAFSIRGVAARLGVPAMSLYRHLHSKQELVARMSDAALGEVPLPFHPPSGWRAQLELAARAEWKVFRRHPWLVRTMSMTRPSAQPNALAYADWMFRALGGHGLDPATVLRIHILLHGYVQGIAVNLETEADTASETGMSEDEWMRSQDAAFSSAAASGRYPHFGKVVAGLASGFDMEFDQLFELGLRALLDGFTPLIEGRASARRAKRKR